jgi:hypothetical protein
MIIVVIDRIFVEVFILKMIFVLADRACYASYGRRQRCRVVLEFRSGETLLIVVLEGGTRLGRSAGSARRLFIRGGSFRVRGLSLTRGRGGGFDNDNRLRWNDGGFNNDNCLSGRLFLRVRALGRGGGR